MKNIKHNSFGKSKLWRNYYGEKWMKMDEWLKKMEIENQSVVNKLEEQKKQLNDEINNLRELKNKNYDLDELYQKYITDYELEKNGKKINEQSLGKKIKKYLRNTGLNPDEFSHRFIESNLLPNLNITGYNYIYIPNAEKKLVELQVLTEEESNLLCKILLNYSDEYIREDLFSHFIQGLIEDSEKTKKFKIPKRNKNQKKVTFSEDENTKSNLEEKNEEESEEGSESYDDNPEIKPSQNKMDYSEKIRQKIRGKYYTEFENILKNKSATTINRVTKGHLVRKKIKIKRIYTMIMAKRITKLFRKNYEEKMKIKNEAAKKVSYLIQKNYWTKKDMKIMAHFSSLWMKQNKNLTLLDKKNIAATLIQTTWKKTSIISRARHSRI